MTIRTKWTLYLFSNDVQYNWEEYQLTFCTDLQLRNTNAELPMMEATLQNISARLKAFGYLHTSGLYSALQLQQLNRELEEIHQSVNETHKQNPNKETHNLLSEVDIATPDH